MILVILKAPPRYSCPSCSCLSHFKGMGFQKILLLNHIENCRYQDSIPDTRCCGSFPTHYHHAAPDMSVTKQYVFPALHRLHGGSFFTALNDRNVHNSPFLSRATCGKEITFVKQFSSSAASWPPIHLLDKSFELCAPLQNAARPTQNERALVLVRHIS